MDVGSKPLPITNWSRKRMDNEDFRSLDRKANAGREALMNPYGNLWQALMDVALSRVECVLRFAKEWRDIRFMPDYEKRRHRCRFHLDWILSDATIENGGRFTFKELVQFSRDEELSDIDVVRDRILSQFEPLALESVMKPINPDLMDACVVQFKTYGLDGHRNKTNHAHSRGVA